MKTADCNLGDKVTDTITGFTGIVTGIVHYISGCDQALLTPRVKDDGTAIDARWYDIDRLALVEAKQAKKRARRVGADMPAPIR